MTTTSTSDFSVSSPNFPPQRYTTSNNSPKISQVRNRGEGVAARISSTVSSMTVREILRGIEAWERMYLMRSLGRLGLRRHFQVIDESNLAPGGEERGVGVNCLDGIGRARRLRSVFVADGLRENGVEVVRHFSRREDGYASFDRVVGIWRRGRGERAVTQGG